MQAFDVLIVGGGPSGSTCARSLREAGLRVAVVDKQSFPRDKTCAGWVTPHVVETLGMDLEAYASAGRTLQPITGFLTGTIGGAEIVTRYPHPVSYGIRRCEFDHYLLQRSGAELLLGTPVRSIARTASGWTVNECLQAPLLIGAGGHFCPVARLVGARDIPGASVVAAQEAEFRLSAEEVAACNVDPRTPQLFFCRDLKGYGWCFRKEDHLNVGLGRREGGGLSTHVAEFCQFLRQRGSLGFDIACRFHGHAYQLYERASPTLYDDGVLLIGDAAGLAYPQSGEGIRPAVESGLIAADVVSRTAGDYSAEALAVYAARMRARFGQPRTPGVTRWIPHGWLEHAAARLLTSRKFAERVVIDRWFLHRRQPLLDLNAF